MKLLNKTSIYYLLFAVPVFAICSFVLYNLVSSEIQDNLDESLWKEKIRIEKKAQTKQLITWEEENAIVIPIGKKQISDIPQFSDTLLYDSIEGEIIPFRIMTSSLKIGGDKFLMVIQKSAMESEDLIESIIYPIILLFIVLLFGFLLINWYISKKLWTPFYKTLEQLSNLKITDPSEKYASTDIQEFSELNKVLTTMTGKMQNDFISQKQFIENASHEIQTPLAVIKTKIELLIQSANLNEKDMQLIQSVYNASNKLSSLNKALLLLSKIENNQFKDSETIELNFLIEKTLLHLEDLIAIKNIRISKELDAVVSKKINPILADILISNLVQNAIRHNIDGGQIGILSTQNSISISNTSDISVNNTEELFLRFRKNEASAESIGLGLAIVKEICDNHNISISYSCVNKMHTIELNF